MAWGVGLRVELDVGGIDAESLGHLGQQGAAWVAGCGKGSEGCGSGAVREARTLNGASRRWWWCDLREVISRPA